ncbi:MAG: prephenate dehydrogenase/arogenate dehydrogenase family protein [Azonexus sp.]|jgi:prephenate dehydrogenase|nr:prephenate dehydrogenase/arogenate dehydrogenase family protein [Rhodocyclaceae bacterium]HNM21018.1 prephenate dehydrogenase/arogenate dehydrogenase family protein [Rhodocyclaceae bacterium]
MAEFGKIVIFGTGLIGGSFALALKEAGAVEEVVGFGRTPATLKLAQELGVIDRAGINPAHEVGDADIVLVATPVAQMPEIFERIVPYLGPDTIITDGGSTKGDVVAAARAALKGHIGKFVPAHPIAGAENSGPGAARADLYRGKKVVVTPLPENNDERLDRVKRAWALCGADIHELTPEMHDRVFAAVSHLPHLLSFALVHELAKREDADLFFTFAASGYRDFTRIAASHPEMWRDICLANRDALVAELDGYMAGLARLRIALEQCDGASLEVVFDNARRARRAWTHDG